MATKTTLADIEPREMVPGYSARFIHTEHTTHAYWEIDPHKPLPEHSHPHEQTVNVLAGTIELVVGGESHVLEAGDVLHIPGGVPHSAVAHTPCRVLDVFSPVREEYR
ncbi:MAG: cupin domain-containing protein [Gemmatimonadetes bacterium]|nr:cupin domain-containing protein [Gemmatimonadota bacterium]